MHCAVAILPANEHHPKMNSGALLFKSNVFSHVQSGPEENNGQPRRIKQKRT